EIQPGVIAFPGIQVVANLLAQGHGDHHFPQMTSAEIPDGPNSFSSVHWSVIFPFSQVGEPCPSGFSVAGQLSVSPTYSSSVRVPGTVAVKSAWMRQLT